MLIENTKSCNIFKTIYTATLDAPQFIKLKESQTLTFKNEHFDFTESHYYLKDVLYKVVLKRHGDGVYLSKEIVRNARL